MAYARFMRKPARRKAGPPVGGGFKFKGFVAPTRGWVTAENLAAQRAGSARVLDDMFPEKRSVRLRNGSTKHATVSTEPVETLLAYVAGATRKMFAASDGKLFEITSVADEDVAPTPDVTGLANNYWSYVNFATAGGNFMPMVNGEDTMLLYDGTYFYPVTGTDLKAINYDAETGAFTEGETLTGGTSAATATIVKVIDNGTTGTLWVNNISGTFQDNETITDSATGSATEDGTATTLATAITGVDTDALSHVNVYRNRQYLVEDGSMNVHYLGAGAIAGAVATLSLAGVFQRGGSVLLTATWSMDAGDGLDDKFIVVSTEGEVAVYEGAYPGDSAWSLVGRYDMTPPKGRDANMRAGGDLLLATKEGLVPVSAAVTKDPAALGLSAVSAPIEPDWQALAVDRDSIPWGIVKWPEKNMAIIATPALAAQGDPQCFVVNVQTGAWARYRNWDVRSLVRHDGQVYFGTNTGTVLQAEVGGSDEGSIYYPTVVWNWDHLGQFGSTKTVHQARATMITATPVVPKISVSTDYTISLPSYPASSGTSDAPALWDVGLWDVSKWDVGITQQTATTRWVSVAGQGSAFALAVQFSQSGNVLPAAELVEVTIAYETGGLVV